MPSGKRDMVLAAWEDELAVYAVSGGPAEGTLGLPTATRHEAKNVNLPFVILDAEMDFVCAVGDYAQADAIVRALNAQITAEWKKDP